MLAFFIISSLSNFFLFTSQLPLEVSFSEFAFLEKEAWDMDKI